eukprot:CAMPEP_0197517588 /NCGR_PEP_ID=MMETSP1318-20131121/2627_1 /TAXON_ID=552666 /ORGANISM="Partenskyella glossopodia, Strain RCC365" /LENGTH=516 /DNA_ID=CAMNT_0043067273 /DNA_START=40 /DNA_END=1590 /DNA_ORIENTATION=+
MLRKINSKTFATVLVLICCSGFVSSVEIEHSSVSIRREARLSDNKANSSFPELYAVPQPGIVSGGIAAASHVHHSSDKPDDDSDNSKKDAASVAKDMAAPPVTSTPKPVTSTPKPEKEASKDEVSEMTAAVDPATVVSDPPAANAKAATGTDEVVDSVSDKPVPKHPAPKAAAKAKEAAAADTAEAAAAAAEASDTPVPKPAPKQSAKDVDDDTVTPPKAAIKPPVDAAEGPASEPSPAPLKTFKKPKDVEEVTPPEPSVTPKPKAELKEPEDDTPTVKVPREKESTKAEEHIPEEAPVKKHPKKEHVEEMKEQALEEKKIDEEADKDSKEDVKDIMKDLRGEGSLPPVPKLNLPPPVPSRGDASPIDQIGVGPKAVGEPQQKVPEVQKELEKKLDANKNVSSPDYGRGPCTYSTKKTGRGCPTVKVVGEATDVTKKGKKLTKQVASKYFKSYDVDKNGKLSPKELAVLVEATQDSSGESPLIKAAGSKPLTFDKFYILLNKFYSGSTKLNEKADK